MATNLYILFEHASGYALFRVKDFEGDVATLERSTGSFVMFQDFLNLIAFQYHQSAGDALESINLVSVGALPEELQLFVETNLPKKKKHKMILGVSDPKLGTAIQETLNVNCQHTDLIPELIRGIRLYFNKFIPCLTSDGIISSESSLGRSYSRSKVKFNVNRADNMIIQSISLIDLLDKDVNTFAMRLREWYSYHFPELVKIVPDNYLFAKIAKLIGNRANLEEDEVFESLQEILDDEEKAEAVLHAAKISMGVDIGEMDFVNINSFATRVINLVEYRQSLIEYLHSKMNNIAPNLSTLIGDSVGARLISHAGSLKNLAKCPASTVQILGAEKSLFRAIKTRGKTPKYGLIFHSSFIGKAGVKNKGRISRFLANKCSIASRIDCFSDDLTDVFGTKLKEQVEERLSFFAGGEIPRKNIDVMKEAMEEAEAAVLQQKKAEKKKKKKRKAADMEAKSNGDLSQENEEDDGDAVASEPKKKKKKKKKNRADDQ